MFKTYGYTLLTVLTVDLLATSGDITMTWTSPMLIKLYSNDSSVNPLGLPITEEEDSWIASLINLGAMIGPFPFGFIAGRFGRRIGLLSIAVPHVISYLTLAFSKTVYLYYFARLLGGIAVGGGYTLLPLYVAEVAEDSNRGMLSSTLNIFWTFGNLIPYVLGPYTSALCFNIILACIPASFFVLFFIIAPESPYYLLEKKKVEQAEQSLLRLRSNDKKLVEHEIEEIQVELKKNVSRETFVDLFKSKVYLKALIIATVLLLAQQFSGINVVLLYTEEIFKESGVTSISPEISAIVVGIVIFATSFTAPLLSDRLGRRLLLLVSTIGVTIAHVLFGTFFYLKSVHVDVGSLFWVPIFSLVLYFVMFNLALGPTPWTIASEIFPTSVKTYAATTVTCITWSAGFLLTKFFNTLNDSIGQGETFWLFGGVCFFASIYVYFFVPETKQKSFQEIQGLLEGSVFMHRPMAQHNSISAHDTES